ncbi:NUDIX domain-containing protein [Nonomuraea mesophila]|uniref:NUDIX domain-containing protein n=1 Tax=Nonomuraea mesophila TaxID=2530382 RepID=UPI003CCC76A0
MTAVLRDGDRVLLCHRSAGRRWHPDVSDLPGGHVEEGEHPKESLVRELREELESRHRSRPARRCMRSGPRRSTCRSGWSTGGPEHPSTPRRTSTTLWRGSRRPTLTACVSPTAA